ncbi:MAG: hypothetical protein P8Y91_02260 [Desulfuromonadales bacterium]
MLRDTISLQASLEKSPLVDRLLPLARQQKLYLVGGAVRDGLSGLVVKDLDVISPTDPTDLARTFARDIGGHWFWLDEARQQSRVVVDHQKLSRHFDFAPFRGDGIEADLCDRDFTVNAMAIALEKGGLGATLIDPCDGAADLRQKILRMVSPEAFVNDPLRIVKGVRHATILDFAIASSTLAAMQTHAVALLTVAPERIRQEVWQILGADQAARGLDLLLQSGAGPVVLHAEYQSAVPWMQDRLGTCRKRWLQLADGDPVVREWLQSEIEQGLTRSVLVLWSLLLQKLEPQLPLNLARQWLLSRKTQMSIEAILELGPAVLEQVRTLAPSQRTFHWLAYDCRVDPQLLLLVLVVLDFDDRFEISEVLSWVPLVKGLSGRPKDLVDGEWIKREFALENGPEISRILKSLRNAEMCGQVSTPAEARRYLRQRARDKD